MTIQFVIPYLRFRWCLEDMLESFGDTDVPILIIDNSASSDMKEISGQLPGNVTVEYAPYNMGVAASWNRGLILGADQTVICSQWIRFAPAEFPRRKEGQWGMEWVADKIRTYANEWGLNFGDQGYHLISIGRKTVDTIGYFDENFYPTHGEDDDYGHRMNLSDENISLGGFPKDQWEDMGIYSIAFGIHKKDGVVPLQTVQADYYSHKWCSTYKGYPGDFSRPFNNPNNSLAYWPEVRIGSGIRWDGSMMS